MFKKIKTSLLLLRQSRLSRDLFSGGRFNAVNTQSPPPVKSGGAGIFSETFFDFGNISMARGVVRHSFPLRNGGDAEILISRIYTLCMCTTAVFVKDGKRHGPYGMEGHGIIPRVNQTLAPGESAEIEVIFNPAAHGPAGLGRVTRTVYLETDTYSYELNFAANVGP